MLKQPVAQLLAQLDDITTAMTGAWDGAKMILFVNDYEPATDMVIGDLTEATFTGYAASSAIVWADPFVDDDGNAVLVGGSKEFKGGGDDPPQTVYGYAVVDAAKANIFWAERLPNPVVMDSANKAVVILPKMTKAQQF